ncbi:MAG: hypothetical protein AABX74_05845 [Nanoarchaeota archaeon]
MPRKRPEGRPEERGKQREAIYRQFLEEGGETKRAQSWPGGNLKYWQGKLKGLRRAKRESKQPAEQKVVKVEIKEVPEVKVKKEIVEPKVSGPSISAIATPIMSDTQKVSLSSSSSSGLGADARDLIERLAKLVGVSSFDARSVVKDMGEVLARIDPKGYPKTPAGQYKAYKAAAEQYFSARGTDVPSGFLLTEEEFRNEMQFKRMGEIIKSGGRSATVFGADSEVKKKAAPRKRRTVRRAVAAAKAKPKRKTTRKRK